jgi:DNA helicase II / ATP-dependent DNA helicase PcrA
MELTPHQREAVEHKQGPLLIIAGAGTGKTMVITHRIGHLIATKQARPEEILALTFTEKAAREMEERVDQLVPYGYADVWISTFHAFGDRVLHDHAILLGLSPAFRVLTRPEQVIFLRDRLFELPLDRLRPLGNPTKHLGALLTTLSRAKDEDTSPSDYLLYAETLLAEARAKTDEPERADDGGQQIEVARTYQKYQELLARSGFIDFGDQVALTLKLFREHPAVLSRYQRRFRYILVDEFQDTNFAQYQLVKLLGREHRNITVVGDDDQSIYRFRGAAMSNILIFGQDWPEAKQVVLTENRRSTQAILNCAYRLIRHNDPERLEVKSAINKHLTAMRDVTTPISVQHLHYDTLSAEADGVARLIKERRDRKIWSYRDVAILVRANDDADPFLRSLNFYGVPWRFSGSRGLYSLSEVRQLIAFLRVLSDPHDSPSLYFLASCPLYQLPMADLIQCNRLCSRQHLSLYSVFQKFLAPSSKSKIRNPQLQSSNSHSQISTFNSQLSTEGQATISRLLDDLSAYQELSRNHTVGVVLYEFFKRSGWLHRLSELNTPKADMELQNIARFFDAVRRFESFTDHPTVPGFVHHLDALIQAGDDPPTAQADSDADAVTVLTIHRAKGLEFPVVFMVSLVEHKFPTRDRHDAIELPEALIKDILPAGNFHLQEERRLFYVGMTRAMNELYLTSARDYGSERERKVSRFVVEALDLNPKSMAAMISSPLEVIKRHESISTPVEIQVKPLRPDDPLQLSYYKMDDYLTCPLKYKYTHILHMPIYQHHAVIYGAALHQAIAAYLRARVNQQPFTRTDLHRVFEQEWRSEGFISREHEEQRFAAGKTVLDQFYMREEAREALPTTVEQPFKFAVGPNIITGRWDRMDEHDGNAVIIDYKSSHVTDQKKANRATRESLQLSIYTLAYQARTGKLPSEIQLHFLESGLIGHANPTDEDTQKTRETIQRAAEGIRAQDFTAKPTYMACSYCAYREICPHTSFGKEEA